MCDALFNFFRIYSRHLHNLLAVTLHRLNWVVSRIQSNLNYKVDNSNKVFYYNIYFLFVDYVYYNLYYFRIMLQKVF